MVRSKFRLGVWANEFEECPVNAVPTPPPEGCGCAGTDANTRAMVFHFEVGHVYDLHDDSDNLPPLQTSSAYRDFVHCKCPFS